MSLLEMSFAGGMVILAVIVLRALAVHRLPRAMFTALWAVAVLRLLVPVTVPSAVSVYGWLERETAAPAAESAAPAATPAPVPALSPAGDTAPAAEFAAPVEEAAAPAGKGFQASWPTLVWAAGALGLGAYFALGYVTAFRRFREAVTVQDGFVRRWQDRHPLRRKVSVRLSGRVDAPMTYGLLRPVVLLPADTDWRDEERLGLILGHEYAHIRRLDGLRKLILTAAVCLHWFNPLVWVMLTLANRDMEMACDEQVVRGMDGDGRAGYARALIDMAEARSGLAPLVSHFSKSAMEERVTAIMKRKKITALAVMVSILLTVGVTAVFATGPAAQGSAPTARPTASPAAPAPSPSPAPEQEVMPAATPAPVAYDPEAVVEPELDEPHRDGQVEVTPEIHVPDEILSFFEGYFEMAKAGFINLIDLDYVPEGEQWRRDPELVKGAGPAYDIAVERADTLGEDLYAFVYLAQDGQGRWDRCANFVIRQGDRLYRVANADLLPEELTEGVDLSPYTLEALSQIEDDDPDIRRFEYDGSMVTYLD